MANIKKEVFDSIKKKLDKELYDVRCKVERNKYAMKQLAAEQAKLKRERGVLHDLITSLGK